MTKTKVESNLNKAISKFRQKITQNVLRANTEYAKDLRNRLDDPGTFGVRTGKIYNIKGKEHQASAADQPPAVLTGELRDSIQTTLEVGGYRITGKTFSDDEKALWMEFGTGDRYTSDGRYTGRIEPRPAWRVVFTNNLDKYRELMTEGF